MPDASDWRKKAQELRRAAAISPDAEKRDMLLVLADDCDEIAAELVPPRRGRPGRRSKGEA